MAQVNGYHANNPDWRGHGTIRAGELIGVELEVRHPSGNNIGADALDMFDNGPWPRPLAEIDGSLCRTTGFEIICPPIPAKEAFSNNGYFNNMLKSLKDRGVVEGGDGYGMHVNINVADWSLAECNTVCYLINRLSTTGSHISNRQRGFGAWMPAFEFVREANAYPSAMSIVTAPRTKYAAAHLRGRDGRNGRNPLVMEFRAPRASLNIDDLRVSVEYVFALRRWATAVGVDKLYACAYLSSLVAKHTISFKQLECSFHSFVMNAGRSLLRDRMESLALSGLALASVEKNPDPYNNMLGKLPALSDLTESYVNGVFYDSTTPSEQAIRIAEIIGSGRGIRAAKPSTTAYAAGLPAASGLEAVR